MNDQNQDMASKPVELPVPANDTNRDRVEVKHFVIDGDGNKTEAEVRPEE